MTAHVRRAVRTTCGPSSSGIPAGHTGIRPWNSIGHDGNPAK